MLLPRFTALLLLALHLLSCQSNEATPPGYGGKTSPNIQLNQVGYYPDQRISFTSTDTQIATGGDQLSPRPNRRFFITGVDGDSIIREGMLGGPRDWTTTAGTWAQPTETGPLPAGNYRIYVSDQGYSHSFRVAEHVLREPLMASIRGLYYQRASQKLDEKHAGKWARAAGHPDTEVLFHPSSGRDGGSSSSAGGWYDAGDYNKYVVNGAFSVGQYLALYEDVGDPAPDGSLNIPESGNGKSDYLDELKYELDWLLTMQDTDGGMYHKLTTLDFEDMNLTPERAGGRRYIVGKSSPATFDFAAAAGQAARVYRDYDGAYADRLLAAARLAWRWGSEHPTEFFKNPAEVTTGEYGDDDATDERAWAAAELFATTGEQEFLNDLQTYPIHVRFGAGTGWNSFMANMAAFSLLRFPDRVPGELYTELGGLVTTLADSLLMDIDDGAYHQPIDDFGWGSNSDVLNAAMTVAAAHRRNPKASYVAALRQCMNYILGNNPNDVCYLTGFGSNSPRNIHHRPSASDSVDEPVPGLLSGGPNSERQDRQFATYPAGGVPMRSWVDQQGSYASNEICLNWNAPLTYVLGYLEARRE